MKLTLTTMYETIHQDITSRQCNIYPQFLFPSRKKIKVKTKNLRKTSVKALLMMTEVHI